MHRKFFLLAFSQSFCQQLHHAVVLQTTAWPADGMASQAARMVARTVLKRRPFVVVVGSSSFSVVRVGLVEQSVLEDCALFDDFVVAFFLEVNDPFSVAQSSLLSLFSMAAGLGLGLSLSSKSLWWGEAVLSIGLLLVLD